MSLINEALKRARIDAARRDAAAKGVPPSALPVYRPPGRRSWLVPVAGFAAGLAAVALAAGAFWLARRPLASASAQPAPAAVETPVAATAAAETPAVVAAAAPPAAVPPAAPPREPSVASPSAPAPLAPAPPSGVRPLASAPPAEPPPAEPPLASAVPPASRVRPASGRRPLDPSGTPPPPARSRPEAGAAGLVAGKTYLREAAPAGEPPVKVEFIVWSESRPFAQINGQLLSPGESAGGYTLLSVERERVELENAGIRFWIRVR